jgi:hypothetical protein
VRRARRRRGRESDGGRPPRDAPQFIGFNRACHAVLEAATARRGCTAPREFVEREFARLQIIVDKTAGAGGARRWRSSPNVRSALVAPSGS